MTGRRKEATALRALVSGSGRCGTNSIASYLNGKTLRSGKTVIAKHETDWYLTQADALRGGIDALEQRLRLYRHQIEVNPLFSALPRRLLPDLPLIAIIRDGRRTVATGMRVGWFDYGDVHEETWMDLRPYFVSDRFSYCCQYWSWTNRQLEIFGARFYRLEDLAGRQEVRSDLLMHLEMEDSISPFPHRNQSAIRGSHQETAHSWETWTKGQREVFTRFCGDLMDEYYPGWRTD